MLKQTSGLNDVFYKLYEKLLNEPQMISPREAVLWGKENLKPVAEPGKKHFYTDTNYYLLGLIIENVTGKHYHKVLHEFIFHPLAMKKRLHARFFSTGSSFRISGSQGCTLKMWTFCRLKGWRKLIMPEVE